MTKHWFHSYLLQHYSKGKKLALDVGCANRPYHDDYLCSYIGCDMPTRSYENIKPDFFVDGCNLPFGHNEFDLLVSYSVMPYVERIEQFIDEMHRVLKPNGTALVAIMNLRGLALYPDTKFKNRYNSSQLNQKLSRHGFKSIIEKNLKAWFWANYFNFTSVYAYAIVTTIK